MSTSPFAVLAAVLVQSVLAVMPSEAGLGPSERCRVARYKAAAKYAHCQAAALARDVNTSTLVIGGMSPLYQKLAARCRAKYVETRARWQFTFPGEAACSDVRFVDNGDGTVTDQMTGLVWEAKTDDGGIHDKDDVYSWSVSGTAPDGTVFTTFLAGLNTVPCFGGACDWRLPTMAELQTILDPLVPCGPCVDPNLGTYAPDWTWTGTLDADWEEFVRAVSFDTGVLNNGSKTALSAVRAVRGGF